MMIKKPTTTPEVIDSFTGEYLFLSNFYLHPVEFEGREYPSNEHAFQAAKTLSVTDRQRIAMEAFPSGAKRLGRGVRLRPHWDEYWRYEVMEVLLHRKFTHPTLRKCLVDTGCAILIEGNDWGDKTWGMVPTPLEDWEGHNLLGWMLMRVRDAL